MNNKESSLFTEALIRLTSNKLSLLSLIYLSALIGIAFITPFIAPYDYAFQDLAGNCFDLQMHELECKDAAKEIPPQRESDDPANKVESKGFVMSALKYTH